MLTIRVAAIMLFSAIALWAQTPEAVADRQLPASETARAFEPGLAATSQIQWNGFLQTEQFSLKDVESPSLAKKEDLRLAQLSKPLLAAYPIPQASKANTPTLGRGYFTRRKIPKYASFATLPLLAAEAAVGQKLLDEERASGSRSLRSVHSGLTAGLGVLFGVETVTGVWNMLEARKVGPINKKRLFHGVLMLAADAGFVAAAATAPHHNDIHSSASTHQAVAYTSIGVAAFGYIYGLIAK